MSPSSRPPPPPSLPHKCGAAPREPLRASRRPVLMEKPDVVVGTPGRVLAHLNARSVVLRHTLELLVLDEADLLLSFGFGEDLKALLW